LFHTFRKFSKFIDLEVCWLTIGHNIEMLASLQNSECATIAAIFGAAIEPPRLPKDFGKPGAIGEGGVPVILIVLAVVAVAIMLFILWDSYRVKRRQQRLFGHRFPGSK